MTRRSVPLSSLEKSKLETNRVTLASVRESYQKRKATRQLDIDPAAFRVEVEELVDLQ